MQETIADALCVTFFKIGFPPFEASVNSVGEGVKFACYNFEMSDIAQWM